MPPACAMLNSRRSRPDRRRQDGGERPPIVAFLRAGLEESAGLAQTDRGGAVLWTIRAMAAAHPYRRAILEILP